MSLIQIDSNQLFSVPGVSTKPMNIVDLHTYINRCDIVKDAKPSKQKVLNTNTGSLFSEAANSLFPIGKSDDFNGENYKKILYSIKNAVFNTNGLGGSLGLGQEPESIVSVKMSKALKNLLKRDIKKGDTEAANVVEKYLPETYQYAFHDSGDTPGLIQGGIKQILTPGSYIDPAGRAKDGILLPPNGNTNLTQYGFPNLEIEWKWNMPNNEDCQIHIKMGDIDFIEIRDNTHKHSGGDFKDDYFSGNDVKNNWFNSRDPNGRAMNEYMSDAKKIILCKELGDTTQATFARFLFETNSNTYNPTNCCLFTLDNILAIRCRLLGVPCCAKDHGKGDIDEEPDTNEKHRRLLFYQPPSNPEEIMRTRNTIQVNECIKHNASMRFAINQVLAAGFIAGKNEVEKQKIDKTPYMKEYFYAIQDSINIAEGILKSIDINRSEEDVRRMVAYLRVNDLFKVNKKKNFMSYELINSLRNVFQYDSSDFYKENISSKISPPTEDTTFQDFLRYPSMDIMANYRDKISKQRKTIFEQVNYLLQTSSVSIDSIMAEFRNIELPELVGGVGSIRKKQTAYKSTAGPSKFTRKTLRPKITIKVTSDIIIPYKQFCGLYGAVPGEVEGVYDIDTIDLFWKLYSGLNVNSKLYSELYAPNYSQSKIDLIQARLDYMEDFAFFLYPIFRYLGETTYDLIHLQRMHDLFYVPRDTLDNNNEFQYIVSYYIHSVLIPREKSISDVYRLSQRPILKWISRPINIPFGMPSMKSYRLPPIVSARRTKKKRSVSLKRTQSTSATAAKRRRGMSANSATMSIGSV